MERELHHKIIKDFAEIKEKLREKLHCGELSYRTWIEDLEVLKIEEDCIWLGFRAAANQEEIASYLNKKYKDPFEQILKEYGADINVYFVIKSEEESNQVFNPDFTFDNFLEGEGNRFPYELAKQALENPATYNPIIFYGKAGCGKTHLLHAIANKCHENQKNVYMTSAESFIYDVIEAFRQGDPEKKQAFVETYITTPDILIFDNIEMLDGLTFQDELRRICWYYFQKQKQLVFASTIHPSDFDIGISHLPFYQYSVIAQVFSAGPSARVDIANKEFLKHDIVLASNTVTEYLAEQFDDVRNLKKIIRKIIGELADSGCKEEMTLEMVEEIIGRYSL